MFFQDCLTQAAADVLDADSELPEELLPLVIVNQAALLAGLEAELPRTLSWN